MPSFIIGIGRGGLAPAVYLSHATGCRCCRSIIRARSSDFSDAPLDPAGGADARRRAAAVHRRHQRYRAPTIGKIARGAGNRWRGARPCAVRDIARQHKIERTGRLSRRSDRPPDPQGLVRVSVGSSRPADVAGRRCGGSAGADRLAQRGSEPSATPSIVYGFASRRAVADAPRSLRLRRSTARTGCRVPPARRRPASSSRRPQVDVEDRGIDPARRRSSPARLRRCRRCRRMLLPSASRKSSSIIAISGSSSTMRIRCGAVMTRP